MTDLLDEAQRLVDEAPAGTVSAWPRAAALLTRQVLEMSLDAFWAAAVPVMAGNDVSGRVKLSCLRFYVHDQSLAPRWSYAWSALPQATHHHPYDLDPRAGRGAVPDRHDPPHQGRADGRGGASHDQSAARRLNRRQGVSYRSVAPTRQQAARPSRRVAIRRDGGVRAERRRQSMRLCGPATSERYNAVITTIEGSGNGAPAF